MVNRSLLPVTQTANEYSCESLRSRRATAAKKPDGIDGASGSAPGSPSFHRQTSLYRVLNWNR